MGAILATDGIENTLVVRMGSEAEALDFWRREVVVGNRIACLGTASVAEVSARCSCKVFGYTQSLIVLLEDRLFDRLAK